MAVETVGFCGAHAQCHRAKFSTMDITLVYKEELPCEGKQLSGTMKDFGMFVVSDLVPRLKERGMLHLGNKVGVFLRAGLNCVAMYSQCGIPACYVPWVAWVAL